MINKIVSGVHRPLPNVWGVLYAIGGEQHEHRFFADALHWRAAEYGIDPADSTTLLDIVLHEPHIATDHTGPEFLYACDQATARTAHLRKIAAVKAGIVSITDPDRHLDAIHQAHTVDPAVMDRIRAAVIAVRAESTTSAPLPVTERGAANHG